MLRIVVSRQSTVGRFCVGREMRQQGIQQWSEKDKEECQSNDGPDSKERC